MPSELIGLFTTLQWTDYGQPRAGAEPGPGQKATAAQTSVHYNNGAGINPTVGQILGSHPTQFHLLDQLRVSINLNPSTTFVMGWALKRSQQFQNDLLNHEQGHYHIAALLARDFFIDLMLLKQETFPSVAAIQTRVTKIRQDTGIDRVQKIHDLYDADVHPQQAQGIMRGQAQVTWDNIFKFAFTHPRVPATQSPDGKPHLVRLATAMSLCNRPFPR